MIVQTEKTPNPNTLKFLPGKQVSRFGPVQFSKEDKNIGIPLAKDILSLKGTTMVFFGEDFITVKKEDDINWKDLKHGIISQINDYYSKGNEVIIKKDINKNTETKSESEDKIISKIKEVLDSKIRPAVARDGGDIQFKSFDKGIVKVDLRGSCSGCPSSLVTLKQGVQNLLCHYVPEVKQVEAN